MNGEDGVGIIGGRRASFNRIQRNFILENKGHGVTIGKKNDKRKVEKTVVTNNTFRANSLLPPIEDSGEDTTKEPNTFH